MTNSPLTRFLAPAAAAIALAFAPSAASAQAVAPAALGNVALLKSDAILGGTRSALADIMARQQGIKLAAPVQSGGGAAPLQAYALLRNRQGPAPAVLSGRPDVFGTVALSIGSTRLDGRWRKVAGARVGGAHAAYARSLRDLAPAARAEAINRFVNSRVRFIDDSRQYGRGDVWMTAGETLSRGRGDCEDYAVAKLQMLREAGIADRDLYLVIVKDLVRRADHAVLVVRAGDRTLMLDNGSDTVVDSESVSDYRPIITFAAAGSTWTHGYRRAAPTIAMAPADGTAGD